MGGNRVTIQNLEIVQVIPKNVILIKGNVPGARNLLSLSNQQLKLLNDQERRNRVKMANVKLFDQTGKEVSTVELNDAIFGIEPNESVVFDVVISQRASLRQGTHAVKNRSAVSGGGRKPWRQKGTGRARQGSIRSPQWRGGGVVFGPTPRSYGYKLPQKSCFVAFALKSVFSAKVAEDKFVAVEALSFCGSKRTF